MRPTHMMIPVFLFALLTAGCGNSNHSNHSGRAAPYATMEKPDPGDHWLIHSAYSIDTFELDLADSYANTPITTQDSEVSLDLGDSEDFAFQWLDYYGPSLGRSFTLHDDETAVLARLTYYEVVENGETVLMPEYLRAEFKLTEGERELVREQLRSADLGSAPARYERKGIYDGLQWSISLRIGFKVKHIRCSNAVPNHLRDLMVVILRDVCAKHAGEIDTFEVKKGFPPEFTGRDDFYGD